MDEAARHTFNAVPGEQPTGSFIRAHVIDGVRFEVFGRLGDEFRDGFVRFDVYDEGGNWLTEDTFLDHVPSEREVSALARQWHAARTVIVSPTPLGWRVVWVGERVKIGLNAPWWPWF